MVNMLSHRKGSLVWSLIILLVASLSVTNFFVNCGQPVCVENHENCCEVKSQVQIHDKCCGSGHEPSGLADAKSESSARELAPAPCPDSAGTLPLSLCDCPETGWYLDRSTTGLQGLPAPVSLVFVIYSALRFRSKSALPGDFFTYVSGFSGSPIYLVNCIFLC